MKICWAGDELSSSRVLEFVLVRQQRHVRRAFHQRRLWPGIVAGQMVRQRSRRRLSGSVRLGTGAAKVVGRESKDKLREQPGYSNDGHLAPAASSHRQVGQLPLQQRAGKMPPRVLEAGQSSTGLLGAARSRLRVGRKQRLHVTAQHPGIILAAVDHADHIAATGVPRRGRQEVRETLRPRPLR